MNQSEQHAEEALQQLFRHAEPRLQPPQMEEARAMQALRRQWQEMLQQRRARRHKIAWAAAACALMAMGAAWFLPYQSALISMAIVEKSIGSPRLNINTAEPLTTGAMLNSGDWIQTGHAEGLALTWWSGLSIRLDQHTQLKLQADNRVELIQGRAYIDSGHDNGQHALTVVTAFGEVTHIGTQYMIEISDDSMHTSVRQGRVVLSHAAGTTFADAGDRLSVMSENQPIRSSMTAYDQRWQWVSELSKALELDGLSISQFLSWVEQETGYAIRYADMKAQSLAERSRLRGRVELPPMIALRTILQTTDLTAVVEEGVILISLHGIDKEG